MTSNAALVAATLEPMLLRGVRDFVLCAGARNAPLALTLLALREMHGLRLWHHFDERAAAFFALGLARREGAGPAAVLTTSGTAAAALLPALVEAHYGGGALIALTADRPKRYRGSGAPQAIEQAGLFAPYVAAAFDLDGASEAREVLPSFEWDGRSPLHLNLCFEEPSPADRLTLLPASGIPRALGEGRERRGAGASFPGLSNIGGALPATDSAALPFEDATFAGRGLVLLGALPAPWREAVVERLCEGWLAEWPVWAEAASGLREHPSLTPRLLRGEKALAAWAPEAVLRVGGVPSLRFWRDLESRPEVEVLSLTPQPFSGLARPSRCRVAALPPPASWWQSLFQPVAEGAEADTTESCEGANRVGSARDEGWVPGWTLLRREEAASLEDRLRRHPASEPAMLRRLSELIPETALVFLGNSLPIREWNLAASVDRPHPRTHASRGANGIDGQIATWLGLGVPTVSGGPFTAGGSAGDLDGGEESWAVLGDLTALYDLNAPALLAQLPRGRRRLVVVNNGGGRIFSRLPSLAGLGAEEKAVTENRHAISFEAWAALWGMDYRCWQGGEDPPDLGSVADALVCELRPDDRASEAYWAEGA